MSPEMKAFLTVAEQTLQFVFHSGTITPIQRPHGTGWRRVPSFCNAQCIDGRIYMQAEAQATFTMPKNCMFLMPPNRHHNAELVSRGQAYSRWSHMTYSILGTIDVFDLLAVPPWVERPLADKLGDMNEEFGVVMKVENPTLQHVFRKKALGFQFLATVAAHSTLKPDSLARLGNAQRVAPALAYIHAHLHEDLSRDTVAAIVHLSGSRFQTVFRETVGLPPRDYIQRLRMQTAQQLLISSALPIKEIAVRVGHPDPFHFSRAFKQAIGQSPAAYRRQASVRSM